VYKRQAECSYQHQQTNFAGITLVCGHTWSKYSFKFLVQVAELQVCEFTKYFCKSLITGRSIRI
jgi:hypothetical protein